MIDPKRFAWRIFIFAWASMLVFMALRIHTQLDLVWMVWFNELMYLSFVIGMLSLLALLIAENNRLKESHVLFLLVFYLYMAIVAMIRRAAFDLPTIGLLVMWTGSIVFFGPIWAGEKRSLTMLRVFAYPCIVVLLWGLVSYAIFGFDIDFFDGRFALGYLNPNYYAQFILVAVFSYFLALALTKKHAAMRSRSIVAAVVIWGAFGLLFLAHSRNALVALSIFVVLIYVRHSWQSFLLIAAALGVGLLAIEGEDYNSLSSDRLSLWGIYLRHVFEEDWASPIFGVVEYPTMEFINAYNPLREVESISFQKFRADNLYLELFVEWGLLGVGALFFALWSAWRQSFRQSPTVGRAWRSIMWALVAQGLFVSNLFSFFAPVGLFATFFFGLPWYFQLRRSLHV